MSYADDLLDAFAPWLTADLEDYLLAQAVMFQEVEAIVGVGDADEPYLKLLDPDQTEAQALPWLAQWVGERIPVGLSEARQREYVKDRPNSRRGTTESIFLAAQRHLTGSRLVSLRERSLADGTADVDTITVHTMVSQTPDPAALERDLRKNIAPMDVVLDYAAITGQTWLDVRDGNATWADVKSGYADWAAVSTTLTGDTTYSRPEPV